MDISFIIISGGRRRASLKRLISSIMAQKIGNYEVLLVGRSDGVRGDKVRVISLPTFAKTAKICAMRNKGIDESQGEIIVLLDDDVELTDRWYGDIKEKIKGADWDIAGCRLLGPSGRRWYDWNWASRQDPLCPPRMIDYNEHGDGLYISGCMMIARRDVFDKIRFDEKLVNHQRDDVDFCHRAIDLGFKFAIWPEAVAIHHLEPAGRSEADPASGDDLYREAIYLFRKKEYDKAIAILLMQKPVPKVLYHGALAQKELGRARGATETFEQFLSEVDVGEQEGRRLYYSAQFHMGQLMENDDRKEEAAMRYRKALEGFAEHFEAAKGLKRVTTQAGRKIKL